MNMYHHFLRAIGLYLAISLPFIALEAILQVRMNAMFIFYPEMIMFMGGIDIGVILIFLAIAIVKALVVYGILYGLFKLLSKFFSKEAILVAIVVFIVVGASILTFVFKTPNYENAKEVSYCSQSLQSKFNVQFKKEACIENVARVTKDAELCESAGYKRDSCYQYLSLANKNIDLCLLIEGKNMSKNHCIVDFYNRYPPFDVTKCQQTTYISECLYQASLINRDASLCDQISEIIPRDRCYDVQSNMTKNPVLCEKIQNKQYSRYCSKI